MNVYINIREDRMENLAAKKNIYSTSYTIHMYVCVVLAVRERCEHIHEYANVYYIVVVICI